jgi:hypothetical protein
MGRVEASRPLRESYIHVPPINGAWIFKAASYSVVGHGATTFFWVDRWLPDGCIKDFAPHLFARIPKRISGSRLVKDDLAGGLLEDIPLTLVAKL